MNFKSPIVRLLLVATLLIVVAVIGKKLGWFGKADVTKVTTAKAQERWVVERVLANGKIQPEVEVKISPEISGEITLLNISEGDSVKKGQLLAKINPELVLAALDRANAAVNNARANLATTKARLLQAQAQFENIRLSFERSKKLFNQKVIAEAEFQQAEASYKAAIQDIEAAKQTVVAAEFGVRSADASVKETQENVLRTNIYAPIDGIVTKLSVELGERVVGTSQMAGTEMMRVANLSVMQARVEVSENEVVRVSVGDSAEVEVDAFPGKIFYAVVKEISNGSGSGLQAAVSNDQATNFTVKLNLIPASYKDLEKDGKSPFRPGMSASVEIITARVKDLAVPLPSVTARLLNSEGKEVKANKRGEANTEADENESEEENESSSPEKEKTGKDRLKEVVFVVIDNKVALREIEVGIQDDGYIVVKSGLKSGEEVVNAPFAAVSKKLSDGQAIKIVKSSELFK